jgi:hypothetical protein
MPKIQDYQTRTQTTGTAPAQRMPSASGINPQSYLSEGIKNAGAAISSGLDAVLYRKQQEDVSNLHVALAEAHEANSVDLQDGINDGTHNTDEYLQRVQDRLGAVKEKVGTEAGTLFFNQASAQMRADAGIASIRAQHVLVGDKTVQDQIKATDKLANSVRSNPSDADAAVAQSKLANKAKLDAGLLPYEAYLKIDRTAVEQIRKNELEGYAELNPPLAKSMLDKGVRDSELGQGMKEELYGKVERWQAAHRADEERIKKQQQDVLDQAREATMLGFVQKMHSPGGLQDKEILRSNLDSVQQNHYLNLNKARLTDHGQETQGAAEVNLFSRLHLPDGDPNKITNETQLDQAYMNKQIDWQALTRLRGEYQGKKTTQGKLESEQKSSFINSMKPSITNTTFGKLDSAGDQNYGKFKIAVDLAIDAQKKAGKPLSDLYNEEKPEYLGNIAKQYRRTMNQQMKDVRDQMVRDAGKVPTSAPTVSQALSQYNQSIASLPKTPEEEEARNKAQEQASHDRLIQTQKDRINKQKATEVSPRGANEDWKTYLKRIGEN